MRRSEKKIILELIDTINEVHREYKKLRSSGDNKACIEVLTECQESAVSVGKAIEQSEGEGTKSVRLLEKYCEDLYQVSQGDTSRRLDEDLSDIRKSIKSEIPVILEVVFFPYKASMWDSMESIYLAFKARKDVHVYLVPIPYYNRKNDGTVESVHCESDLFPSDEEITDWRSFDVEKIKPDIAFIHNPYDDMNYVTTVDPRFYSFELKKNVDSLVYCPYFSTVGIIPKAQSLCKAYIYADYILTQSEYQSDSYDKVIPKRKFMPMGSPKFDKVISLNNERITDPKNFYAKIPSKWKKKSNGKKIYFYNTSISGLLVDTDLYLDKMEYVFNTFRKHNSTLLLWRPHPLLEYTLKAMRPEAYKRYLELKNTYIDSDIGIFDDSSDISTTVAFSDMFIGDGGTSVTSLFVVTGKPILILNNGIMREPTDQDIYDSYFQIPFTDHQDGYIITKGNLIFKCDYPLKNKIRFNYICSISKYDIQMYTFCCKYGSNLYLAPIYTEDVLVYHKNGNITQIKLKHCTNDINKFFAAYVYDQYIILVPNEYPYIVRIDIVDEKVAYTEDLRDVFVSVNQNNTRSCGGCCLYHNYLLISSQSSNRILKLDIKTMEHEIIAIGEDNGGGCFGLAFISSKSFYKRDSLVILPYKGMVVRQYYLDNEEVREYMVKCKSFHCSEQGNDKIDDLMPFSSVLINKEWLYLAPYLGNEFVAYNTDTGETHELKSDISLKWQPSNGYYKCGDKGSLVEYKDKHYWVSATQKRLYEIEIINNDECKIIRNIPVKFDPMEVKNHAKGFCMSRPWWTQYGLNEDAINSLDSFLSGKVYGASFDRKKELESFKDVAVNLDGTCGQHVCDFLIDKMTL